MALNQFNPPGDEAYKLDTLNVFADGAVGGQTGHLGSITNGEFGVLAGLYQAPYNIGLDPSQFGEIDGLGMGGDLTFSGDNAPHSGPLTFAGGITYRNVDVINVMLGQGDDTFTVSSTLPNTITMVQGGGGNNHLIATGGGGYSSPLLLMASTTQNGQYYNATTDTINAYITAIQQGTTPPAIKPVAREFTVPTSGQSVLDATRDPNQVILYGGRGNALIYGGGSGDQIAGGSGSDQIYAGTGNDLIHVNDGFNIDLTHPIAQIIAQGLAAFTVAHDPLPTDSPTGDPLYGTSSQVFLGGGHDIVFLDHGDVQQLDNPITGTGNVTDARTTDAYAIGLSTVFGQTDGTAVVLAGSGAQRVDLRNTSQPNVVVKNGYVTFSQADGWISHLAQVGSTDPGSGGDATILLGDGNDIVVAGTGADTITGGNGDKIVLGDDGQVTWVGGLLSQVISQDENVSVGLPLANQITLGDGNDVVFGGSGPNTITLGKGNDIVVGANGQLDYDAYGAPKLLQSIFPSSGGGNTIRIAGQNGVLITGPGHSKTVLPVTNHYVEVDGKGETLYVRGTGWVIIKPVPTADPATAAAPRRPPTPTPARRSPRPPRRRRPW